MLFEGIDGVFGSFSTLFLYFYLSTDLLALLFAFYGIGYRPFLDPPFSLLLSLILFRLREFLLDEQLENKSSASSTLLLAHSNIFPYFLFFKLLKAYCSFNYFLSLFAFTFCLLFLFAPVFIAFWLMFFELIVYFIEGCYVWLSKETNKDSYPIKFFIYSTSSLSIVGFSCPSFFIFYNLSVNWRPLSIVSMSKSRLSNSLDPSNSSPTDPAYSAHYFSNSCSTAFLASTPLPTTYFLTAILVDYCCLTLPWLFSRSSPSIFLVYAELSLLFHLLTSFLGYSCIFSFRLICSYLSCILLLLFKYFW